MAIAFVQDFFGSDSDASIDVTVPAGGCAQGNLLTVAISIGADTTTVSTIGDNRSGSNVYSTDATLQLSGSGENNGLRIYYCKLAVALQQNDLIQITLSGADGAGVIVSEYSGIASSPFDKAAGQKLFDDDPQTSGTTATTTQNDELCFGAHLVVDQARTWTPNASYSPVDENQVFFSTWRLVTQHKIVAATGQYESNGTLDTAGTVFNIIGTFKAETAGTQTICPDADITTTGWTSTPLWSKIGSPADATIVTATAA